MIFSRLTRKHLAKIRPSQCNPREAIHAAYGLCETIVQGAVSPDEFRIFKPCLNELIKTAHAHNTPVGICGQAPSDYPDFVEFLVEQGIDSISLTPDTALRARQNVAAAEAKST